MLRCQLVDGWQKTPILRHDRIVDALNPNNNFLSFSKTWFHKMEVSFCHLNNFSNSSTQTAAPSPAETLPPPSKPMPPSSAPTSHPAPPTLPGYSDDSPPLLQPTKLEKIIPQPVLSLTNAGFGGGTDGLAKKRIKKMSGREREEEEKKNLMCVSGKKNHRNKNQASTSMGFLLFSGSTKNEDEKEEGRKKEKF
jgi:hypothetical protein